LDEGLAHRFTRARAPGQSSRGGRSDRPRSPCGGPARSIVPSDPTAQPTCESAKCTPKSCLSVWLFCSAQLVPTSRAARIVPPSPTAQPVCGSAKGTRTRVFASTSLKPRASEPAAN
jgi:hypothetical protein